MILLCVAFGLGIRRSLVIWVDCCVLIGDVRTYDLSVVIYGCSVVTLALKCGLYECGDCLMCLSFAFEWFVAFVFVLIRCVLVFALRLGLSFQGSTVNICLLGCLGIVFCCFMFCVLLLAVGGFTSCVLLRGDCWFSYDCGLADRLFCVFD